MSKPSRLIVSICAALMIVVAFGGYAIISDQLAYRRSDITTSLIQHREYDPSGHFNFTRACAFPLESSLSYELLTSRGYREVDQIFPESSTNWTVVLIDDGNKTFRTLYVQNPKVKFVGDAICSHRITLRTERSSGVIIARAEESK